MSNDALLKVFIYAVMLPFLALGSIIMIVGMASDEDVSEVVATEVSVVCAMPVTVINDDWVWRLKTLPPGSTCPKGWERQE